VAHKCRYQSDCQRIVIESHHGGLVPSQFILLHGLWRAASALGSAVLAVALAVVALGGGAVTASAASVADPIVDRDRAAACLAAAVAYEAGFEPIEGQEAVAAVVLNRVRHPAYPKTVCGVVFAGSTRRTGCQFTFTCDGALARRLPDAVMAASRKVAAAALDGLAPDRVGNATHYHADYVAPYWAPSLLRVAKIGAHIFYRLPGAGEAPPAAIAPLGGEPEIAALGRLAGQGPRRRRGAPVSPPETKVFAPWGLSVGR
jgi:hypothetical protein